MDKQEPLDFIRNHIGSIYTLELLLLIKRERHRAWTSDELVRELRSSGKAVAEAISRLKQAGMALEEPPGCCSFAPLSPEHDKLAAAIEQAYASRPMSVVKAIVSVPDEKLRAFSNAFKLKE